MVGEPDVDLNLLDWAFYAVEDMEALPKFRKRVNNRIKLRLCLDNRPAEKGDPEVECDQPAGTRCLCKHHHHKFLMEKLGTDKAKREAYDKARVLRGTIAPNKRGQGGGRPRTKKQKAVAS